MRGTDPLVIHSLSPAQDRTGFNSGVESLDRYLKKQARQDIKRRMSRVFVATRIENLRKVVGYYTLSSLSIELYQLPAEVVRKLPRHPVPAALIGRLAVHQTDQGKGIGKMLLVDAFKRTLSVSDQIAIYAMVVDAINNEAKGFYKQFGFIPLRDHHLRLFMPLQRIDK
jgi:GNAT superfamily N-acetyltransferase